MLKKIKDWFKKLFSPGKRGQVTVSIDPDGYEIPNGYFEVDGKPTDLIFNLNENDNIDDKDFEEIEGLHDEKIEFNGFRLGQRRIGFKPEERGD